MHDSLAMRAAWVTFAIVGCAEQKLTPFNAVPDVRITSHDEGDPVSEGMPERFVAGVADPDHEALELLATWDVEGEVVCEAAPVAEDGITSCELVLLFGQRAVSVVVSDPLDGVGGDTVRIDLAPTEAPRVSIQAPDGDSVYYTDQAVRFEVHVSDAEDAAEDMLVSWTSSLDGAVGTAHLPTTDGTLVDSVLLSEGAHGLTVVVTDSTGKTGSDATDIEVGPANTPPDCRIRTPTEAAVIDLGFPLLLEGEASDVNVPADWLQATWTSDKRTEPLGGGIPSALDGLFSLTVSTLEVEDHTITLQVKDERGATCTDVVRVTVTSRPEAEISSPVEGGRYYLGHGIEFSGVVTDAEDGPGALVAEWSSDRDGVLSVNRTPAADGIVQGIDQLSEGEHTVWLTVTDADGATGTDTVTVRVGPGNTAPTCAITAPASGTGGDTAASVSLQGVVDDVDEGFTALDVQWTSDWDGELGSSTSDSDGRVALTVAGLSVNTHMISLMVTDEVGEICTAQVSYEVGRAPDVTILSPIDASTVNEGEVVTFSGVVVDEDEVASALFLLWSSDLDGVLSSAGADTAGNSTFTRSGLTLGNHTITLTATDALGLYTTALITLRVNAAPTAPLIHIAPEPATTLSTLSVVMDTESVDPDGGVITYEYAWSLDGVPSGSGSTVAAALTAKHQTWSVRVTPTDGFASGTPADASRAIVNSAPVVTDLAIVPNPLTTDDVATVELTVSDPDGDEAALRYAWTVDGAAAGIDSDSLDGAIWFSKHQVVDLSVSASDAEDTADPVVAVSVLVVNTAPLAPTVFIDPEIPAVEFDDLWCRLDAPSTDADEDPLSYTFAWAVDGLPFPASDDTGTVDVLLTALWTNDTVPAVETIEGEEWVCTVTPNDDEATGPAGVGSAVIAPPGPRCGDGNLDPGEELDPPPSPYINAPLDETSCRYDFSEIQQLYCSGECDYGGAPGCDQTDADVLCKLITDNPDSVASSYTVTTVLSEYGFSGIRCGLGERIDVDRGLDAIVGFQDTSLFATHGGGQVVAWPVCTTP